MPQAVKFYPKDPNSSADNGGSDLSLLVLGKTDDVDDNLQLVQTWGSPWSPMEFIQEAVKAGHPSQLDACLPFRLKLLAQKFRVTSLSERCKHRIQKTKFRMDRMASLKSDEIAMKASMHKDVRLVLADKTSCCGKKC